MKDDGLDPGHHCKEGESKGKATNKAKTGYSRIDRIRKGPTRSALSSFILPPSYLP